MSNEHFRTPRHTILMRLSKEVGETCNIAVPDRNQMRYLDCAGTPWPLRMQLPVGAKVPLHCTSSGKLYLSMLPQEQFSSVISNMYLEQKSENTLTSRESLTKALAEIRKKPSGYR